MCNMCTRDTEVAPLPPETVSAKGLTNLERMKRKHNITTNPADEEKQKEVAYQPDLLAVSTQYTKLIFDVAKDALHRFQESKTYVVLTRTTQPFHLALGLLVLATWLCNSVDIGGSRRLWQALYVMAVAIHLGAQVWMTFVSGIVLYLNLPRHEFGRVQTVLFPVYYAFNACISLVAFLTYCQTQYLAGFKFISYIQMALLLFVFSIEAFVRLRLVRPMLRIKHLKTQMEEAAGNGQEVGKLILGELAHCPRYMAILRAFRKYHSGIAMGTMITFGCSVYSTMIIVDALCR